MILSRYSSMHQASNITRSLHMCSEAAESITNFDLFITESRICFESVDTCKRLTNSNCVIPLINCFSLEADHCVSMMYLIAIDFLYINSVSY